MKKKLILVITVLLFVTLLSACVSQVPDNMQKEPGITEEIDKGINQEEVVEQIKILSKENTKIDDSVIQNMYKDNAEMMGYINTYRGELAPDAKLIGMNGEETSIKELIENNDGLIIEFMGSWCPVCKTTVENINEFHKLHPDKKIISIAINTTEEELNEFINGTNSTTEYYIPADNDKVMDDYGIMFVPAFFTIDSEGYIQMILAGNVSPDRLLKYSDFSLEK